MALQHHKRLKMILDLLLSFSGNLKLISNPLHPDVSPTTMTAFDHTYQTIGDVFQQQQHQVVEGSGLIVDYISYLEL